MTARPPASTRTSAAGASAAAPTQATRRPRRRRRRRRAGRAGPSRARVVGDELADAGDHGGGHGQILPMTLVELATDLGPVAVLRRSSGRPPSRGVRPRRRPRRRRCSRRARCPRCAGTRGRARPGRRAARRRSRPRRPSRARRGRRWWRPSSSSAAVQWPRCCVASRSSSSTARISSNGSITAWLSEPSVSRAPASCSRRDGPMPSPRSRSVVGQKRGVGRGAPPRAAMSSSVRWVACTSDVVGPSRPWSASSWVGVTPYASRHASFSATCSERWTCSGRSPTHAATASGRAAGTARTEWMAAPDPRVSADGQGRRPARPSAPPTRRCSAPAPPRARRRTRTRGRACRAA